ncbi:cytochrome P450 [Phlyctema vagabunda]|uniref:Cytochrome P450 n=1 Tax=Phlyctema vagabunda TaxID=108571 RepID=A0ABR4PLJ7_9HELO
MSVTFFAPLVALFVIFLVAIWKLLQRYCLSPLTAIPNASVLAPLSRLTWAFITEHHGKITLELPELHRNFGSLVRIGPQEVSYRSLDIYKAIHMSGNKFIKDPRVYGGFVQNDHPSLFSLTDPQEHAARRRMMGQLFNRSKMPLVEGLVIDQTDKFIGLIQRHKNRVLDLIPACRALEADVITLFGFGDTIGALDAWAKGEEVAMVTENDNKSQWMPLHTNFATIVETWYKLESILFSSIGYRSYTTQVMAEYTDWTVSQLETILSGKRAHSEFPNFVSTMLRSGLPARTALAEAKEQLGPGTDTTSATLSHILWALAHDTEFQHELHDDLEAAGWPEDLTALELIPKLKATIKEGIRWAGAAAAMLPRIAPKEGVTFDGKFIPGGTVLTSSPIWYLHDENAFPLPHLFCPRRWLEGEDKGLSRGSLQDEYYIPFSKGAYSCMGAHFSYLELYVGVSRILKNFQLSLPHSPFTSSTTAVLPTRLEWVAAVPLVDMKVCFEARE